LIRKITNQAMPYAWGSRTLISDYLGIHATGQPMAEIWFGTHHASMASDLEDATRSLLDLRDQKPLSFLLKVLAADSPLSIQAHPNLEQAAAGFERENRAGIPLSAAHRNYKDAGHKPEMIVALSEFEALCGFRSVDYVRELLEDIQSYPATEDLKEAATQWSALLDDSLKALVSHLLHSRAQFGVLSVALAALASFDGRFELCYRLNKLCPGDPGVFIAMMMHHVHLQPGQALFLPAGNIHAYLSGLGVEVMAASDNVLRGGLTPKHIDVTELESVVNFNEEPVALVHQVEIASGLIEFKTPVDDFILYRLEPSGDRLLADLQLGADAVALCTAGEVAISNSLGEREVLKRGEAAFISNDAKLTSFAGSGTLFVAVGRD
jgi:mannose-6-phosphate isomerase